MSLISRSIEIFKILFKSKIIKVGILVNAIYLIIGMIYYFTSATGNDFTVYYQAGHLSITDLNVLYHSNEYTLPFRYLPISALFFSILTIFHPFTSYIIYTLLSFAINIPIIIMIYYIIFDIMKMDKKYESLTIKLIFVYLVYLPHIDNYCNGQINLLLLFFLLCSYCLFLSQIYAVKNKDYSKFYISNLLGGIFLGLAILIKITALIILPFILVLGSYQTIYKSKRKNVKNSNNYYNSKNSNISDNSSNFDNSSSSDGSNNSPNTPQSQLKIDIWFLIKINILRFSGTIIILTLNIIFFVIHPELLKGFMNINISGSGQQWNYHSISITRQILNLLLILGISIPDLSIMLVILVPLLVFNLYISLKKGLHEYYLSFYYSLALFTLILGYYDTWVHHLVVICPFIIISLITMKSYIENNGSFKNSGQNYRQNSVKAPEIRSSNVKIKDYKSTTYIFFLMGAYLWLLLYYLTENLFYNHSPGLNFIYPIIILLLYMKIIKFLLKSS